METQAENTKENVQKEKEVSDKTRKLKQKKCTKEKIPKKTKNATRRKAPKKVECYQTRHIVYLQQICCLCAVQFKVLIMFSIKFCL